MTIKSVFFTFSFFFSRCFASFFLFSYTNRKLRDNKRIVKIVLRMLQVLSEAGFTGFEKICGINFNHGLTRMNADLPVNI